MDADLIKTVSEVAGAILTSASILLVGMTGRVQRIGLIVALAAIVPWTVFAVVTSSWLIIVQSAIALGANGFNLWRSILRARHAP